MQTCLKVDICNTISIEILESEPLPIVESGCFYSLSLEILKSEFFRSVKVLIKWALFYRLR